MTPIARYNLITALIALLIIIISLSILTYVSGDMSAAFSWSAINPIETILGLAFALSFGLGMSLLAVIFVMAAFFILVWVILTFIIRRMTH